MVKVQKLTEITTSNKTKVILKKLWLIAHGQKKTLLIWAIAIQLENLTKKYKERIHQRNEDGRNNSKRRTYGISHGQNDQYNAQDPLRLASCHNEVEPNRYSDCDKEKAVMRPKYVEVHQREHQTHEYGKPLGQLWQGVPPPVSDQDQPVEIAAG